MFICDLPQAEGRIADGMASLVREDASIHVSLSDQPGQAKLEIVDKHKIVLRLPAHEKPVSFRVFVGNTPDKQTMQKLVAEAGPIEDLPTMIRGGPGRWKEETVVKGERGEDAWAYTIDTISLPDDNPYGSWMRPGAIDFFADGRAVVCTWSGDVWVASGIDDKLDKITWKRFATGIFEALGVKVVSQKIYVLGRDQITRLHDLNNDGEADFYENFNNDGPTAPSFHSFAMDLHTDPDGNFYYSRGAHRVKEGTPMHGGVIKVARDGSSAEILCQGLREANGISVGPDGTITAADNQGNWVPSSKIDFIRKGGFYGYVWAKGDATLTPEKPLCWIPHKEDNSSGGQVWVTSDQWGPFEGHLLHTAYGSSKLFKVFVQRDGERFQGGVIAFPLEFPSGIMRARFNPKDDQLYVCGLKGWGTNAKTDGSFHRVRYTGKTVTLPKDLHVSKGTIKITFPGEIDPASVKHDVVSIQQWNYRWTQNYGSKDYLVSDPKKEGRDSVTIKVAKLSEDGRTLILSVPDLKPVMQMSINLGGLKAKDGSRLDGVIYNTINYLP
jgi:glucose/arabinose dehydrogenase